MNLILFGFKASGKTHFGKLLAVKMHRPFIDTDDLVLELYKKERYRNNLMNREFGQEGPQNSHSERETIAERQGSSENGNSEVNLTPPKTDSSGYFGRGQSRKAKQIYEELGKEGFRELEKRAIHLLKNIDSSIIALGGGSVLDPENVEFLQKVGALVFLKASPEKLKKRIFKEELPSFFDEKDPEGSFWKMIQEREPIYRSIPARAVDTDVLDEAGVVAALSSILLLEEPPNGF